MKMDSNSFGDAGHLYQSTTAYGMATVEPTVEVLAFKNSFKGDFFTARWGITVDMSLVEVVDLFRAKVEGESTLIYISHSMVIVRGADLFVTLSDSSTEDDPWEKRKRNIRINVHGEREAVRGIIGHARSYPKLKNPKITWNYISDNKRAEAVVFAEAPMPAPDSFYPYIDGGIEAYIRRYMASNASILLLRGEPGTGKTSFIRNLIWTMNTDSMITYEDRLFQSDEMFVAFLTCTTTNLLIMEDADTMLLSRERDGNQTMAKFLNVSDGLIRFPQKKVIISSNLVDEDRIDSALMRPGRCFDAPVFRKLTYDETLAACRDAERDPPEEDREYALSEILNAPAKYRNRKVIGFTGFKPVRTMKGA